GNPKGTKYDVENIDEDIMSESEAGISY
ncbi:hypothetical protein NPIL_273691, partial [Nephila pilipes]